MKKTYLLLVSLLLLFSFFLAGCTQEENWKESEMFESNGYTMLGIEDRLGFIYDDEVTRFYAGEANKYMWHFWGDEDEFDVREVTVNATHELNDKTITLIEGQTLGSANNGADKHMPSNMSLPKSGMWKLDAYVGDNLHGSVFVKVYEE
ncbi:hypothetical protein J2R98_000746 [Alkalibacillus filiformis]|uniref:DUF4871 domain-containing protein n=1 Tax=Alkalibacillus filiformis TaxID=200990 RepID=A0ABU0DR64_9BACI|nr:DUF4871 domain-containing protein [Alkalibacillus filiformis]MDQ0350943.1 hypothetical protein [Alkalibacillus filiformis]